MLPKSYSACPFSSTPADTKIGQKDDTSPEEEVTRTFQASDVPLRDLAGNVEVQVRSRAHGYNVESQAQNHAF